MKKTSKITAVILAVIMLVFPLASCSGAETTVMEYGNSKITANMYSYWLSRYKAMFMYSYADMQDTDEFWNMEMAEGVTAEQFLTAVVQENIKTTLVCMELFDSYGLKITNETSDTIQAYIDDLIKEQANGSRSAFNQIASAYGVNDTILKEIYIAEQKVSQLYDYFYGENGIEQITDTSRDEYYKNNYSRAMHLYINNVYKYETDENGNVVTDSETGYPKMVELTAEEKAEKNAIIKEIDDKLAAGTPYEELYEQYSEDKNYPNGYYLSATSSFIPEVTVEMLQMEVGEVSKVESSYGVHYLNKLELDEKAYANEENADFFADYDTLVGQGLFQAKISAITPEVIVHQNELANYSLRSAKANYSF